MAAPRKVMRRSRAADLGESRVRLRSHCDLRGAAHRVFMVLPWSVRLAQPAIAWVTMPLSLNSSSFRASQPPISSTVNRSSIGGNWPPPFLASLMSVERRKPDVGVELLDLGRVEVLHERLGDVAHAVLVDPLVDDRDRVLDQHGRRRVDRLVLEAGFLRREHLVLVGDRHVAVAGLEVLDRVTGVLVEHDHVAEHVLQQRRRARPCRPRSRRRSHAAPRPTRTRGSSAHHRSMRGRASGSRRRRRRGRSSPRCRAGCRDGRRRPRPRSRPCPCRARRSSRA